MAAPSQKSTEELNAELDWIKVKADLESTRNKDLGGSRLSRLVWSNPFVPIGVLSTVLALGMGIRNFYQGRSKQQQLFMRARVGAQGFTVFALMGGIFYQAYKDS